VASAPSLTSAIYYKGLSGSVSTRAHAASLVEMRMPSAWTLCSLSFVWSWSYTATANGGFKMRICPLFPTQEMPPLTHCATRAIPDHQPSIPISCSSDFTLQPRQTRPRRTQNRLCLLLLAPPLARLQDPLRSLEIRKQCRIRPHYRHFYEAHGALLRH
jgi:hypothetical protein